MDFLFLSKIGQIVISFFLVLLVVIQSKGSGLSSAFGGSFTFYRARRGVEKIITFLTVFLGLLLVLNSLVIVLLS